MSRPPSAGPTRTATSREGVSIAIAAGSTSRGTSAGMSACRHGWSNVAAAVVTSTLTITCQACTAPVSDSAAMPKATTIASAWVACSSRRRSQRSAKTPPSGLSVTSATACAPPTRPVAAIEPVRS